MPLTKLSMHEFVEHDKATAAKVKDIQGMLPDAHYRCGAISPYAPDP